MTTVIGLSGYARSGKDTVGRLLVQHRGFEHRSFAAALKDALYRLNPTVAWPGVGRCPLAHAVDHLGWEAAKDLIPEVRPLLQRMGTDVGRAMFGPDVWVNLAMAGLDGPAVFTDCRFPNEAHAIRREGGQVWRIARPGTHPANAHPSETALDDWPFDLTLLNDQDLPALEAAVLALIPS